MKSVISTRKNFLFHLTLIRANALFLEQSGSKLMRFSQFLISGKPVEYVQRWPHLGNIIGEEFTYSECVEKRRDVLGQVNDVLSIFRKLDPTVKIELLYRYCSSFYG